MIHLMRVVSFPFILIPVLCVLVVHGSDAAEEVMDSYNNFFNDL